MEKRIKIRLNGIDELRNFVNAASTFEEDINIIKGTHVFDAKSIMGVIDIAPEAESTYVEIISKDQEVIEKFNKVMEEFKA